VSYHGTISFKMADLKETWSNVELHNVIRFLRQKGATLEETYHLLVDSMEHM
jgi:hypothetical protein